MECFWQFFEIYLSRVKIFFMFPFYFLGVLFVFFFSIFPSLVSFFCFVFLFPFCLLLVFSCCFGFDSVDSTQQKKTRKGKKRKDVKEIRENAKERTRKEDTFFLFLFPVCLFFWQNCPSKCPKTVENQGFLFFGSFLSSTFSLVWGQQKTKSKTKQN